MNNDLYVDNILDAIYNVLPKTDKFIALHEPVFEGNEWQYVKECLDTGWVSSVGKFVDLFEKNIAEYTGAKKAIAVVNGTAALHLCLKAVGVKEGDEVIAPAITFIATANAISYCGAVPHFVDSEYSSLGIDAPKLDDYLSEIAEVKNGQCYNRKTGRCIKVVLPMHTFGHPVDIDAIKSVCEKYKLILVEDAAESLGSYYKNRHTGKDGVCSALSFNGNKLLTTGGGGAILTNDENLAKFIKHISTTAKIAHKWEFYHDMLGYNYRMPNINAALGCAQLEKTTEFVEKKRNLANRYNNAFKNIEGVKFFTEPENTKGNYWLNAILLDEKYISKRDEILERTNSAGIMTRPVWNLMYTLPMYQNCPRMECSVAEDIAKRLINLPSSSCL